MGILVSSTKGSVPFASRVFFRRLTLAGARLGVAVYVFAPEWIDWVKRVVRGYAYDAARGGWTRRSFPLPALVYDRAFFRTRAQKARHQATVSRLLRSGSKLLGYGLHGKLEVYDLLREDPSVAESLPETVRYEGPEQLADWLRERTDAVVKPHGGTHGKGVFRLRQASPRLWEARGRSGANRLVARRFRDVDLLARWVDRVLVGGRPFLIQPYLPLSTDDGRPFDIRALVQKDGSGGWHFTGAAARVGPAGGLTSNLHGGGTPREAAAFLQQEYGEDQATDIMRSITETALAVPPVLERGHGPLLELGIDFGVDRLGRAWVLEVNSKPGRTSFTRLNDKNVRIAAVTSPIRYARYVLDRQLGGQINEFDVKQGSFYTENG
ncbi:YheC/YheD family protein [Paenibacillus sp. TRM 82003]|nr:YheC/YheD family protein [Paenibacillus sp. TRM 82003]